MLCILKRAAAVRLKAVISFLSELNLNFKTGICIHHLIRNAFNISRAGSNVSNFPRFCYTKASFCISFSWAPWLAVMRQYLYDFLPLSLFSVCFCVQVHAKPVHSPQIRHVHKLHATKLNFIVSNWKVYYIEAVADSSFPFSIPFPSVSLKYIRYSLRTWKWCWKRCLNMNWTLKSWWCYMSKKKSWEQK